METSSKSKVCRTCGGLFQGRLNAFYCSNECRFEFNNDLARKQKLEINGIYKILLKNRQILKRFLENGQTEVTRGDLIAKGYNFTYLTHQLKAGQNENYVFCFEYGHSISINTLKLVMYDRIF